MIKFPKKIHEILKRFTKNFIKFYVVQNHILCRTYLAGQIARAAVIYQVDEIIIFDESDAAADDITGEFTGVKKKGNPNQTLARILGKNQFA